MSSPKDLAKPAAIVVAHAKIRGLQLGAGVGLAIATPALLLSPERANPNDLPPLVAAAQYAATGAAVGLTVATGAAIRVLATADATGIHKRADDLVANARQRRVDRVGAGGAVAGLALEALRVRELARVSGKCVYGITFSKQTAWEAFGFAAAGAAVAVGSVALVDALRRKLQDGGDGEAGAAADETKELADESTETAVAEKVGDAIDAAASAASKGADGN